MQSERPTREPQHRADREPSGPPRHRGRWPQPPDLGQLNASPDDEFTRRRAENRAHYDDGSASEDRYRP